MNQLLCKIVDESRQIYVFVGNLRSVWRLARGTKHTWRFGLFCYYACLLFVWYMLL